MDFTSPTPRRVSRPSWLDLRLVLGIALVLAAVLIGATVVSSARHSDHELALTRTLAAGAILRASDLETVDTQLADRNRVYVSDKAKAVGKVLARPVTKGELLPSAAVGRAPQHTTVSLPLPADAAPALRRGQRIVVWLTTKTCPGVVLLADVTVQDVHAADAGSFASGGAGQDVVLNVAPELAHRLVGALGIDGATMRAGVLTGAPTAATDPLPPLDDCGIAPGTS